MRSFYSGEHFYKKYVMESLDLKCVFVISAV